MSAFIPAKVKPPLYRKVNTTAHRPSVRHGGDFRDERHSKAFSRSEASRVSMRAMPQGLDYKPLFRFLLSKVGQRWDDVHAEAVARLDKPDPIFWLVARDASEREGVVRIGESSYFSGLHVDDAGLLQKVDPDVSPQSLKPTCACCTHTFNGKLFSRKYEPPAN